MKKSFLLFIVLTLSLAVFGNFPAAGDSALFGVYDLTSMMYGGTEMDPGSMGMSAELIKKGVGTTHTLRSRLKPLKILSRGGAPVPK